MSQRGSKIVCLRVPPLLLAAIQTSIQELNGNAGYEAWTMSTFLLSGANRMIEAMHFQNKENEKVVKKPRRKKK